MERTEKGYRLSTGRDVYAHLGILGLSPDATDEDDVSRIFEGFDGGLFERDFSREERVEIADFMIAEWQRYRAGQLADADLPCACGCGRLGPGGRMEAIHPEDYRDERG